MRYTIPLTKRPPNEPNKESPDPNFGQWVAGKTIKVVDGEEKSVEYRTNGLPRSVNTIYAQGIFKAKKKKPACGVCGRTDYADIRGKCCDKCMMKMSKKSKLMNKAETFPYRIYDDQRKDVMKLVRKTSIVEPDNIALKPVADGFIGIFFAKNDFTQPYTFALTSLKGVMIKPLSNLDRAMTIHQELLDEEGRISLKLQRKETFVAVADFADRLSKAFPTAAKEPKVKQAKPMINAGKKTAGAGPTGKTRYNYSQQGKEKGQPGKKPMAAGGARPAPPQGVEQVPEQKPFVDPKKLATLLQTTPEVLRKLAVKFQTKKDLGGRSGFVSFFQKKYSDFVSKHKLTSQYLRMLFEALTHPSNQPTTQGV